MRTRMTMSWVVAAALLLGPVGAVRAQTTAKQFEPQVGQAGKDVVWVPTETALVEKMLDLAKVTPQDFVVDLGSGDGRNVIAAAKRGATALGVEYNPDMVALSRRNAERAGVGERATFVQGDMFEADFSKATVLALFLLPSNMLRLREKFLNLRPGTRIVANTFGIEGWEPDVTERLEGECATWCNALLWVVPAKVQGRWRMGASELTLTQTYQTIAGTINGSGRTGQISGGRLRGDEVRFNLGGVEYVGKVSGDTITGTTSAAGSTSSWTATRMP